MPNQLEEKLRIIKNRKIILKQQLKNTTDRKEIKKLIKDYETLNEEEIECLKELGVI